jgi:hypothetical protein
MCVCVRAKKPRKPEKKKPKKPNREKKPFKILKKPAGSVRFHKPKTEPNRNRKKPEPT